MKPEEHLMQHYRYWTIPDLGLSEDEKGYVEALRIGAEAIKEVERLRRENTEASVSIGVSRHANAGLWKENDQLKQRIEELEAELQANALTIDARNIRFAELREPTNTEETES